MEPKQETIVVSYLNIKGQTGLPAEKQLQIEHFLKETGSDILHLQETHIDLDTFEECSFIKTNYSVIFNNAQNKYGTSTLIKNDFHVENIYHDTNGRIILFEVCGLTFGNFYLPSGTDGATRLARENYFGETIPNMLVNSKPVGCIGGDLNCIINNEDATNNPQSKFSPCLSRLVKAFNWCDSFRKIHPAKKSYSRYYEVRGVVGASRIDRQYHWGEIEVLSAVYTPIAFSDHLALVTKMKVPDQLTRFLCPKSRPIFKIREEVAKDKQFQERVKLAMEDWVYVRSEGLPVFQWWELIVKPGLRKIAMNRSKEINLELKSCLNLLLLRQAYLVKKLKSTLQAQWNFLLAELAQVQSQIQEWYQQSAEKVKNQSRVQEF